MMRPALAVLLSLGLAADAHALSEQERAQAEYAARQDRLRCEAHPDQWCLVRPESENERAQREYRERQLRLHCDADPTDAECR